MCEHSQHTPLSQLANDSENLSLSHPSDCSDSNLQNLHESRLPPLESLDDEQLLSEGIDISQLRLNPDTEAEFITRQKSQREEMLASIVKRLTPESLRVHLETLDDANPSTYLLASQQTDLSAENCILLAKRVSARALKKTLELVATWRQTREQESELPAESQLVTMLMTPPETLHSLLFGDEDRNQARFFEDLKVDSSTEEQRQVQIKRAKQALPPDIDNRPLEELGLLGGEYGDNIYLRQLVVDKCFPLLKWETDCVLRRLRRGVLEEEELIAEGILGIHQALLGFKTDKGTSFKSYVQVRIRGTLKDYLRKLDWAPRLTRYRKNLLDKARENLHQKNIHLPTREELFEELGHLHLLREQAKARKILKKAGTKNPTEEQVAQIVAERGPFTEQDFEKILKDSHIVKRGSLSAKARSNIDNTDRTVGALISDPKSKSPSGDLEAKDSFNYYLKILGTRERIIIESYYLLGLNMETIGNIIGASEARVSQMFSHILAQLRASFRTSTGQKRFTQFIPQNRDSKTEAFLRDIFGEDTEDDKTLASADPLNNLEIDKPQSASGESEPPIKTIDVDFY